MKKTVFFVLILTLLTAFCLPAFAAEAGVTVKDSAALLSDEEKASVAAALSDPAEGVRYYIVTGKESSAPSDSEVIRALGFTKDDAVVILWIRQVGSVYYYDLYTFGAADGYFSDSAVDRILDDTAVYNNLKNGRIAAGAQAFLRLADAQCKKGVEKAAARARRKPLRVVLVGLIVGSLAGFIAALGVFFSYRKKQHGESYPLDRYAKLHLTDRRDVFVGSYVTRVRVSDSSSGRSGGGGGGFSGGHRGGR